MRSGKATAASSAIAGEPRLSQSAPSGRPLANFSLQGFVARTHERNPASLISGSTRSQNEWQLFAIVDEAQRRAGIALRRDGGQESSTIRRGVPTSGNEPAPPAKRLR